MEAVFFFIKIISRYKLFFFRLSFFDVKYEIIWNIGGGGERESLCYFLSIKRSMHQKIHFWIRYLTSCKIIYLIDCPNTIRLNHSAISKSRLFWNKIDMYKNMYSIQVFILFLWIQCKINTVISFFRNRNSL